MAERTDEATDEKARESWGAVLKPASFRGELVFGPNKGRNVGFAHPADQVGEVDRVEPGEALARMTRRFPALNGPATRDDLRIEPFAALPRAVRRAAEAEADRLAGWLGGELELTWSGPSARATVAAARRPGRLGTIRDGTSDGARGAE